MPTADPPGVALQELVKKSDAEGARSSVLNQGVYEVPYSLIPRQSGERCMGSSDKRILVVDDDEGVRENLSELFASEGYVVTAA